MGSQTAQRVLTLPFDLTYMQVIFAIVKMRGTMPNFLKMSENFFVLHLKNPFETIKHKFLAATQLPPIVCALCSYL